LSKEQIIVELDNVSVRYPNGFEALTNVTMQIYEKDFLGLIGPNGSGKTTLIGVILGLIPPTTGSLKLFGEPFVRRNLRRVGYVPQKAIASDTNFPSTVFETVLMGRVPKAGILHRFGKEDFRRVEEVLRLLALYDLRKRKIGELSGGQSQRVFLAKALVADPQLLILDEPTSGVDAKSAAEFYGILEGLNRDRGITMILALHDIGMVTRLSNRIACMNGSLFFCGKTSDFAKSTALSEVYGYPVELVHHGDHA
jgi:zinc transport system ATP-binding protein